MLVIGEWPVLFLVKCELPIFINDYVNCEPGTVNRSIPVIGEQLF